MSLGHAAVEDEDEGHLFGRHAVAEALAGNRSVLRLLVADGAGGLTQLIQDAGEQGVPVQHVPRIHLDRLAGTVKHQGVAAMVAAYDYVSLEELLETARGRTKTPLLLLLDGVQDPGNLGSILRTAEAAGVDGILLPKHRSTGLTASVARSSAGAIEHLPIARVGNLATTAARLQDDGFWLVGTDSEGDTDFREVDYSVPLLLAVGGEGSGLGRALAKRCDWTVRIPMHGKVNSLNASVAAALLIYEIDRQRRPSTKQSTRSAKSRKKTKA